MNFDRPLIPADDLKGLTRLSPPYNTSLNRQFSIIEDKEILHFLAWYMDDDVAWLACRSEFKPPSASNVLPSYVTEYYEKILKMAQTYDRIVIFRFLPETGIGNRSVEPRQPSLRSIFRAYRPKRWADIRTESESDVIEACRAEMSPIKYLVALHERVRREGWRDNVADLLVLP
jgi:hypothetical protein